MSASCAFEACSDVSRCPLPGGCLYTKGRRRTALGPAPVILYNTATGGREDLRVAEEEPGVAEKRWRAKRGAYLKALLAEDLSPEARAAYERERVTLSQ